jgi:DNA-binding response OmpR family regulator
MNTPPNDGNENVIDIFVLSTSSSLSSLIRDQLEIQGYNVTFFPDGTDLITTLRSGKPNLLMCDTSSADAEGYDVCRQIKADDYLWNIPVLILTGASDLGDLLNVLDSNADNFIAQPYDPAYLLSLIEGMLSTPVQRQTPDQIKTQFKIQHDDQIFVVTADRRKLLEFLLSSFEIAVNKSSDLTQAQDTIQSLELNVKKLEHSGEESNRVLGVLSETLKTKEQKISEMSGKLSDREQEITEKTEKIGQLSRDLDAEKTVHSAAEEEIRQMIQERDHAASEHLAASDELQKNMSLVSAELDTAKKSLETTNNALLAQTARCKDLENELNSTSEQNEQVEKEYRALLLEAEQLKVSFASEKNRAKAAEQETNAVLLAKTQAEQDLTQIINDLNSTAKQQAIDITRFKDELESAQTRFSLQEDKLRTLFEEKEQTESALRSQIAADRETLDNLQAKHVAMAAALEERNAAIKTLTDNHAAATAELTDAVLRKDSAESLVESLTRSLEERDATLQSLTDNLTSAKRDLNDVAAQKEQAESLVQSLTRSLEETRSAREKEQLQFREAEESLNAAILERERALEDLRGAHDEVTTRLMSNKDDLTRTKQDLESFIAQKATLEGNLGATLARIRELEAELHAASSGKVQIRTQVQSITEELEHVKGELEAERHYHHDADEKLKAAAVAGQHLEQELQRLAHERKVVQSELVAEQQLRQTAEEQARALEVERDNLLKTLKISDSERRLQDDGRSAKIQKLKEDFEKVLGLQRTLEEQVTTLTHDKLQAEQRAANLSAEIDQARVALADEWEDHMTDQERLAAVVQEKQHLEKALHPQEAGVPKMDEQAARFIKSPDLPVTVNTGTRMAEEAGSVQSRVPETPKPYVLSVEDLFEDDEPGRARTALSAGDPGSQETRPDTTPDSSEDTTLSFGNEEPEEDQTSEDVASDSEKPDDDEEDHGRTSDIPEDAAPTGKDIGFNRSQWLDLLKWAHHCEVLTHEQRMQIVRMGRLIQKGRNLTKKQEEQVMEIIVLVRRLGYRL